MGNVCTIRLGGSGGGGPGRRTENWDTGVVWFGFGSATGPVKNVLLLTIAFFIRSGRIRGREVSTVTRTGCAWDEILVTVQSESACLDPAGRGRQTTTPIGSRPWTFLDHFRFLTKQRLVVARWCLTDLVSAS